MRCIIQQTVAEHTKIGNSLGFDSVSTEHEEQVSSKVVLLKLLHMYCTQPPGSLMTKLKAHTTRAPASRHLMTDGGGV